MSIQSQIANVQTLFFIDGHARRSGILIKSITFDDLWLAIINPAYGRISGSQINSNGRFIGFVGKYLRISGLYWFFIRKILHLSGFKNGGLIVVMGCVFYQLKIIIGVQLALNIDDLLHRMNTLLGFLLKHSMDEIIDFFWKTGDFIANAWDGVGSVGNECIEQSRSKKGRFPC